MRVICGALLLALTVCHSPSPAQPKGKKPPPKSKEMSTSPTIGGKTLAEWEKELLSKDGSKRAEAIIAITGFRENAGVVPQLLKMAAHDPDVSPRVRAVIALRLVGVEDKHLGSVINTLAGKLDPARESQAIVRLEAAVTLKRFAKEPRMAMVLADLSKGALGRTSWEIRHHCVTILWQVGKEQTSGTDAKIYETLLAVLNHENTYLVRLEILQGLGVLGRPNSPAVLSKIVTALDSMTRSENKPLAIWAFCALVAMQEGELSRAPLAKIAKFLHSPKLETRMQAAYALGALNKRAKSKVPMLITMLKEDPESKGTWAAASALSGIGDSSDQVVDALLSVVGHKDVLRAAAGVSALRALKVKTPQVTGTLDKMLEQKDLDYQLRGLIETTLKDLKVAKK